MNIRCGTVLKIDVSGSYKLGIFDSELKNATIAEKHLILILCMTEMGYYVHVYMPRHWTNKNYACV